MTGDPSVQSVLAGFLVILAAVFALYVVLYWTRRSWNAYNDRVVDSIVSTGGGDGWSREALPNLYAIGWRPTDPPDFTRLDSQIGAALGRSREFVPYYRPGIDQVGAELPELHVPRGAR